MSYYDAMREVMDNAIEHDICNLYFYHVMMGLINKAESEHKFLYDEFMNAKGDRIKAENAKLRELVSHLAYVKPAQVTAITHDGKLFRFDEKLAEVGMRYEAES